MPRDITIKFVDFWPSFDPENNPITEALRSRRRVTVLATEGSDTPDILFYSRCGAGRHFAYDCLKIYYTGENDFPNLNECDYAISFYDYDCGGRNIRYPLYLLYSPELTAAARPPQLSDEQALDRGFCSMVMSNSTVCHPDRIRIADVVASYRPIAYGGAWRNNVGGRVADKLEFIAGYKFNLALENSVMPGYVTEKILEPFAAATVPIYWGSEAAVSDFNPEAFVNVRDYATNDSLIAALRRLDTDPAAYLQMLRAPNHVADTAERLNQQLADYLNGIADNPVRHIEPYGEIGILHRRQSLTVPLYSRAFTRRALKLLGKLSPLKC